MKFVDHDPDWIHTGYKRQLRRERFLLGCMALIALMAFLLILATNITLFEDGSIRVFNQGLCIYPEWGCTFP